MVPLFLALVAAQGVDASGVAAQVEDDAEVRGVVVSAATGEPIAGAWVTLEDREYGAYSRRDGRFVLTDMPNVTRGYSFAALGYVPATVTLEPGSVDAVVELSPDESLQPGLTLVLDRLEERRNGARLFDRDAMAYSGAFNLGEMLGNRGVHRVLKTCLDEYWAPGLLVESPVGFYRMEIHGATARVYTEEFLAEMATRDEASIRRQVRPELAKC